MDCITVTPCCLEAQLFFPNDWPFAAAITEPRVLNLKIQFEFDSHCHWSHSALEMLKQCEKIP